MTAREQLSKELEQAPDSLVEEILDFFLSYLSNNASKPKLIIRQRKQQQTEFSTY
jgi:hypothetical protein